MLTSIFRRSSLNKENKYTVTFTKEDKLLGFKLGINSKKQVFIAEILQNSASSKQNIEVDDLVLLIQGKDVSGLKLEELEKKISESRPLKMTLLKAEEPNNNSPSITVRAAFEEEEDNKEFPKIGGKYDILHEHPIDPEIIKSNDGFLEPQTGWRWRPCEVVRAQIEPKTGKGKLIQVRFLFPLPGYPSDATIYSGPTYQNIAPYQYKSPGHVMHHQYRTDDALDVLDYYESKFDRSLKTKWRKCQITAVSPYFIRVHFVNWSAVFDTWLHVIEQADRLADLGYYTERQQVEENSQQVDFRRKMLEKGLMVVEVSPDGNCLFRSISVLLYGDQTHHREIREACCNHLLQEQKRFELIFEEGQYLNYVENMKKPSIWGDELELRALEELYDRPIQMYSCDIVGNDASADPTIPLAHVGEDIVPGMQDTEPFRLSFHGNNHYNAVVKVNAPPIDSFRIQPEKNLGRILQYRKRQGGMATLKNHSSSSYSMKRSTSEMVTMKLSPSEAVKELK